MNTNCNCRTSGLICAAVAIALCAIAMGAASTVVSPQVADIVAIAMSPIN